VQFKKRFDILNRLDGRTFRL